MGSKRYGNKALRAWWSIHVEAWRKSGLSRRKYCREHRLCEETFTRWLNVLLGAEKLRADRELAREQKAKKRRPNLSTDKRNRAAQAFWAMHVEAQRWSGMTMRDYCDAHRISSHSMARWRDLIDASETPSELLFLESFRLHHDGALIFEHDGKKLNLKDVFTAAYVKSNGAKAVAEIQSAFEHFKLHPDYVVTDDAGEQHAIFDKNAHLRLAQPGNYEAVLSLIQDLGPVTDNQGNVVKKQGTLADIAADVLGRAFDVFLRANFESKGGLGIYLTPAPVKQAMLALAFHDIKESTEDAARLVARDGKGRPAFRFCDPACGSGGFLSVALSHLRRTLDELGGKATATDEARRKLFAEMCEHSFVGADSSPQMVMLARVNMALLGAPKARIFYTQNSLTSPQLEPAGFDLICTNPPFGTPKLNKGQEEAKKAHEEAMAAILETFRSDLTPRNGRGGGFDYSPTVMGRAMGGSPNGKGVWKEASTNTDPAVLFVDRCLQLLKPGGRLLIVLPDGVLCNSGDRYVREYIMGKKDEATGEFHGGKAIVKGVISLPADAFKLSGTGAKTSVLYVQKRHARKDDPEKFQDEPQTDVFMAVADTLGYVVKNNVEDYSAGVPNDLAAIVGAYVRGE